MENKKLVQVTKYAVQTYDAFMWRNYTKSFDTLEEAKKVQRKARNETGCRTRIFPFVTNKWAEV